jgi:hypothetical protein
MSSLVFLGPASLDADRATSRIIPVLWRTRARAKWGGDAVSLGEEREMAFE